MELTHIDQTIPSIPTRNREIREGNLESNLNSLKYHVDKSICSHHIRGNAATCMRLGYCIYGRVNKPMLVEGLVLTDLKDFKYAESCRVDLLKRKNIVEIKAA